MLYQGKIPCVKIHTFNPLFMHLKFVVFPLSCLSSVSVGARTHYLELMHAGARVSA